MNETSANDHSTKIRYSRIVVNRRREVRDGGSKARDNVDDLLDKDVFYSALLPAPAVSES